MSNIEDVTKRFLRDDWPVRLCNLASNLGRIQAIGDIDGKASTVDVVIDESLLFIECSLADASAGHARQLADLKHELEHWKSDLDGLWSGPSSRAALCERAGEWCDALVAASGLLTTAK
ncbi:MAG: hypothetical protein FJY92_10605 [Candidatus Hydrogenedentes bacterium]|nr:hypothetical protein [Candidatus Hydrogenedentota bacterium]